MKFYLASSSEPVNRRYVAEVSVELERAGWECTFAWWENFDADAAQPAVKQELELMGIRLASIIVGLVDDNALGTWWELGAAWGLGRRVLIVDRCTRARPLPWFVMGQRVRMSPAPLDLSPANVARYIVAEAAMCPVPGKVADDEKPA
jgi:hypothetical protein